MTHAGVGERCHVLHRGEPAAEDLVELAAQAAFDLAVLRQQVPRPRERVRRGLVAGQEDRHGLVAKLLVGHAPAVALLVLSHQEHGQQVPAVASLPSVVLDQPVDDRVELSLGSPEPHRRGDRQPLEQRAVRCRHPVEEPQRGRQGGAHPRGVLPSEVRVEKRLSDDRQRQARHLRVHVDDVAVSPSLREIPRRAGHHVRVAGDARGMERRLGHPALAPVEVALAGEQPVAQDAARLLEALALHEVVVPGDEHLAHQIGMVQQMDAERADAGHGDVALLPKLPDERDGVPAEGPEDSQAAPWPCPHGWVRHGLKPNVVRRSPRVGCAPV